ncbi:MAG TPA: hypothetical protein VMV78_02860 [Thiobacillus sp.]|nr:hypothetical protein [Thiobacillus sp.]
MIQKMLLKYAAWLISHADARIYTSNIPVGSRIGGADIPELPDKYIILDVRISNKIIILGWFQAA